MYSSDPRAQDSSIFVIGSTNKSGLVAWIIVTEILILLVAVIICLSARLRFKQVAFSSAEAFFVTTVIFQLAQIIITLWALYEGLGRTILSLSDNQIINVQRGLYTGDAFLILALWASKACTGALLFRLSPLPSSRLLCGSLLFFLIFTAAVSLATITVTCNLDQPWITFDKNGLKCRDIISRIKAVDGLDIATEVVISAIVIAVIVPIHAPTIPKLAIGLVFTLRFILVIPIAIRFASTTDIFRRSDLTLRLVALVLNRQVQLIGSTIIATVPYFFILWTKRELSEMLVKEVDSDEQHRSNSGLTPEIRQKPSLATLPGLSPLFGREKLAIQMRKTIRHVPVDIYELDNTGLLMQSTAPRRPPQIAPEPSTSLEAVGKASLHREQYQNDDHHADVVRSQSETRRYTIENKVHSFTDQEQRATAQIQIALAL